MSQQTRAPLIEFYLLAVHELWEGVCLSGSMRRRAVKPGKNIIQRDHGKNKVIIGR